MKKTLLSIFLICFCLLSKAQVQPTLSIAADVNLNGDLRTTTDGIGFQEPCFLMRFVYTVANTTGQAINLKWYRNDELVATTSLDHEQNYIDISLIAKGDNDLVCQVRCVYTYSLVGTIHNLASNDIIVKLRPLELDHVPFFITAPLGCRTPIAITTTATGDPGNTGFTTNNYTLIDWVVPAGWSNSPAANGKGTTLIPSVDGGTVVDARIKLNACPQTFPIFWPINRPTPATEFQNPADVLICPGTYTFPVKAVCGAVSYTYTLAGNSNVLFSNGQNTITTTSLNPEIVYAPVSGANSKATLTAKANFTATLSSTPVSKILNAGTPEIDEVTIYNPAAPFEIVGCYTHAGNVVEVKLREGSVANGYQIRYWRTSTPNSITTINSIGNSFDVNLPYAGFYRVEGEASNACGTSSSFPLFFEAINCSLSPTMQNKSVSTADTTLFSVSPNPAASIVRIQTLSGESKTSLPLTGAKKQIKWIRIVDAVGRPVIQKNYADDHTNETVNVQYLKNGLYFIEISDGVRSQKSKLLIQR